MTDLHFIKIGGVKIIAENRARLAQLMSEEWRRNQQSGYRLRPKTFFSANGQSIALCGSDVRFRAAIKDADLVHADGMSLVFASRILLKRHLPERIATTDFFHDVAREAESNGMSFYLLGADDENSIAACNRIRQMYPKLRLAGYRNGYFTQEEEIEVIENINKTRPDILWVGLGRPNQEYFCLRNRDRLTGVTWIKTCGGLFDFLSGRARRAPDWMQRAGLEWAYRTIREPRRLAWRYLTTNPYALWRMLLYTRDLDHEKNGTG